MDSSIAVDRDPVHGRNLPYWPGDGETVELNPPPFRWLPSGATATYRLQIDRTDTFDGADLIEFADMPWCAKMLTESLATGTWYWRYGVDNVLRKTVWSRAREFRVTDDASPSVYPGRDALKVPEGRPRLFITRDELPEYRRRATEGDLKSIADDLLRVCEKYADEDIAPEPDFLPSGEARRNAYTLTFRATRPPMDRMEQIALAYLLTGDEEAAAQAKRRVLHFFSWDPQGSTGIFHNDEPAMWVMMRGTRAYDWTYDLYTDEERTLIEGAMRTRAADFYKQLRSMPFENNPYSSHPGRTIGFLGEAALEFQDEWPEANEWLDYITQIYWGVYPAWGKDDGGWNEGPGYWGAYMSFGMHYVVALRNATGVDLSQRPFYRNTPYYRLYITPPYSQMSPFGDGTQWKPSRPGALMYWFSTLTRDPHIRWYADEVNAGPGSGPLAVVLKDDSIIGQPPDDLPQSRLFEGVGLACLHTDLANGDEDVTFAMRSSPYGAVSHGHNDQNCFVLEAYGEPLAIATGYYPNYGSPHHDKWTRQTKAKCGITFDGGTGQDRGWQAQGRITAFSHSEDFDLVIGDATKAYGGRLTRAIREVVHVRPGLFVIRDDLASDEPRTFEYWLHAIDEMQVDRAGGTVFTLREKASLTTRFLHPAGVNITQTNEFDPHPAWPPDVEYAKSWHVIASVPEAVREAEILSVLLPSKAGEEGDLPGTQALETLTALGVQMTFPDGSRTVVGFALPGAEGDVELAAVRTDARVFAVAYNADATPRAWMQHGGERLLSGDRTLP